MTDVMPEQQGVDLDELVGEESAGTDELDAIDISPTTLRCCSRSTTSRPSSGSTCAPRIESTFAPVPHRTKITRGPDSRAAGLAMAFKLIKAAQDRWRAVNGPHLVALVRAAATFVNGKLVERPDDYNQLDAA